MSEQQVTRLITALKSSFTETQHGEGALLLPNFTLVRQYDLPSYGRHERPGTGG